MIFTRLGTSRSDHARVLGLRDLLEHLLHRNHQERTSYRE